MVAYILCFWPVYVIGYFFHDGPDEYFEDGVVAEVILYPIVFCVVYGFIGFGIGSMVGILANLANRCLASSPR